MVRGRGYNSRGGGRGTSYRSSGSNYNRVGGGSRKSDFHDTSYRSSNSRYNSAYNSYDSRSRDKFPSRYENRHDGKRYRESSRDRSDERKRPRQEDSRLSSSYTSASSYRNRNDSSRNRPSSPSGNYQGRGSSSTYHRGQRDESSSRRHVTTNDSMGPPKRSIRSSYVVRPRGGGTTRSLRGVGNARGGLRVIRKQSTDMRIMRRKLLLARQRDRARLIKIARLTSSLRRRKGGRSSDSPSGHSRSRGGDKKSDNDEEDDDDEENEEEELDDGDEDAEGDDDSSKVKEKRKKKKSKSSKKDGDEEGLDDEEDDGAGEKADDDANEGDEDDNIEEEGKKTSDTEANEGKDGKEEKKKSKDRKEESSKDRHKRSSKSPLRRSKFIKLKCVHCRMNCVTFKEYTIHLYSRVHKLAMRRVAIRQRVTLSRMRTQQRNAQRDLEVNAKGDINDVKPQFCLLCRLNYRQPKAKHQLSEHHREMKKFLMPYCQTCHVAFKSPMLYEAHRCSLEHIKCKAHINEECSDASLDEAMEADLKHFMAVDSNFMTVDSVGETDDINIEELQLHLGGETSTETTPIGSQFVKKVDAFYCELCRTYNGIREDEDAYIKQHCSSRRHLRAFLRHRDEMNIQEKAEREKQQKEDNITENDEEKKPDEAEDAEVEGVADPDGDADHEDAEGDADGDAEETGDDKLWEDVDKDLGDLLREVEPDEHDEEEEEEDESVLNIDIESEKSKPSKELNGKKEEVNITPPANDPPTKEEDTSAVSKLKKEKPAPKVTTKAAAAVKDTDKKKETVADE